MIKDEFHLLPLFFFFFAHLMRSWPHFGYSPTSSIVLLRSSSRQPPPGAAPPCTSVTSSGGCTESLGFCQQTADVLLSSPPSSVGEWGGMQRSRCILGYAHHMSQEAPGHGHHSPRPGVSKLSIQKKGPVLLALGLPSSSIVEWG